MTPIYADPLTQAIQRLNSNPYNLTKDECIQVIRELRASVFAEPEPATGPAARVLRITGRYHTGDYCGEIQCQTSLLPGTKLYVAPSHAASDVLAERQRQIEREGYTRQHDADLHDSNDLARAAAFYAMAEVGYEYGRVSWPWDEEVCKVKDRYRNFIRAAALLIAAADVERARSGVSHVPVQPIDKEPS